MDSFLKIMIGAMIFGIIFGPVVLGTIVVLGIFKAIRDAE